MTGTDSGGRLFNWDSNPFTFRIMPDLFVGYRPEIEKIVAEVIAGNSQAVSDYEKGKEQALAFLIGQVMKATKGRANPGMAKEILLHKLGGK